jgi:AcrR family transcriptional regulator
LSPERRREQLLEIGARLFAEHPYEDVWIEEVAELAGVSRGLLYHYFPTKRDFYAAVIEAHSAELLRLTQFDPTLPFESQLRDSLEQYLLYAERNSASYRALHRSMISSDEHIRSIVDQGFAEHTSHVLASLAIEDTPVVRLAIRSWMTFVVSACLGWLEQGEVSREQVRELCANTLLHAVRG